MRTSHTKSGIRKRYLLRKVYCTICHWKGLRKELLNFVKSDISRCPDCGRGAIEEKEE